MWAGRVWHELVSFFSSRRRHTRWPRDWSADVCSSDLEQAADGLDFFDRARLQHHPIGLQALLFAEGEDGLRVAVLIDQTTAEPVTRVAALAEAQFDQPALAGEYFGRQLAAVFTGHRSLHRLDD